MRDYVPPSGSVGRTTISSSPTGPVSTLPLTHETAAVEEHSRRVGSPFSAWRRFRSARRVVLPPLRSNPAPRANGFMPTGVYGAVTAPLNETRRRAVRPLDAAVDARPWWRIHAQSLTVSGVALVLGVAAVVFSLSRNLLLKYPDARSHLEIARRVLDSRTPGFVQLGTVWLPIPHLLMLPFIWIDGLWTTGLAGSIVGVGCLIVTAVSLYFSVRLLTGRALPAWVAIAVLLTNPSLLYIQTTALTEPVLLASMTASSYFLLRWMRGAERTTTLLVAGVLAALAVGSRYDGWFFALTCAVAIALTVIARTRNAYQMEGYVLTYGVIPAYAMGLWLLYNWIYFGDPLEFLRGAFSAQQQQKVIEISGQLATKGNLPLSIRTYTWAMIDNVGWVIFLGGLLGLIVYVVRTRLDADAFGAYVFLSPIPFNILALWVGQTIIRAPQLTPGNYFNLRYGLLVLPGLALFIAYMFHRLTLRGSAPLYLALFGAALVGQAAMWAPQFPQSVPVVTEGIYAEEHIAYVEDAAVWIREHYDGGGILIDDATTRIITVSHIHMREYIGAYSGPTWKSALTDPAPYARWIVVSSDKQNGVVDKLLQVAGENPYFFADYDTVYTNKGVTIYKRRETAQAG